MQVISYGGGVQSTALLVLAARRAIPARHAIFVDLLGAENPSTRWYVENVAKPYASGHGIEVITCRFDALAEIRSNPAHPRPPFRDERGTPAARQCTIHWKIRTFRKCLRALMRREGIKVSSGEVRVLLGISKDEVARVRDSGVRYYKNEYPLINLSLSRENCIRILMEEGLAIPDKSSCWFCPFSGAFRQQSLIMRYPHLRDLAVELQSLIDEARRQKKLPALRVLAVSSLDDEDSECSGHCFT